jgi:phosphatidylglycerol:prolipoprotein diacylglycerol transferase
MITVNIDPEIFSIGALSVRWYGLMYVVGIAVGLLVAWPYAISRGIKREQLENIVLFSVPAGLIGARLYYVIQQPLDQYIREPWRIFAFWEGGMAFYGAIFAVVVTIIVLSWKMKISIWKVLDAAALFAIVGQFFGRIGNFINGDVIGYPTDLPWGVVYAHPNSFAPRHDIAYHPASVYEAMVNVVLFGIMWWLRYKLKPGMLFFIYITGYSLGQIIVFTWRDNEVIWLGLKQAQLTAIGVIIAAVIIFVWVYRRQNKLEGAG